MLSNVGKIIEQANILNELKGSIDDFIEGVSQALDNHPGSETCGVDTHYKVWDTKSETLISYAYSVEHMYSEDNYLIAILRCEYYPDNLDYVEVRIKQSWLNLTYSEIAEDIILESKKKYKEELIEELEDNKKTRLFLLRQYEELLKEELSANEIPQAFDEHWS